MRLGQKIVYLMTSALGVIFRFKQLGQSTLKPFGFMFGCRGYTDVAFAIPLFALEPVFKFIDIQHSNMGLVIIDAGHLIPCEAAGFTSRFKAIPAVKIQYL